MSAAKREREARSTRPEPFATMRPDLLLAAAITLPGPALKALLLLHAAWTTRPGQKKGRAIVPHAVMWREGGIGLRGRNAPSRALAALECAGLISLARGATRPGRQGGATASAAEWRLPERDGEPVPMRLPLGVRGAQGKVRLHAERIRADVRQLSPAAFRMLVAIIASPHRDRHGALANPAPMPLSAARLAALLGCSLTSAKRSLVELTGSGRLTLMAPGSGRQAARYSLAGAYRQHERRMVLAAGKQSTVTAGGPKQPATVTAGGPKARSGPPVETVNGCRASRSGPPAVPHEGTMIRSAAAGTRSRAA